MFVIISQISFSQKSIFLTFFFFFRFAVWTQRTWKSLLKQSTKLLLQENKEKTSQKRRCNLFVVFFCCIFFRCEHKKCLKPSKYRKKLLNLWNSMLMHHQFHTWHNMFILKRLDFCQKIRVATKNHHQPEFRLLFHIFVASESQEELKDIWEGRFLVCFFLLRGPILPSESATACPVVFLQIWSNLWPTRNLNGRRETSFKIERKQNQHNKQHFFSWVRQNKEKVLLH